LTVVTADMVNRLPSHLLEPARTVLRRKNPFELVPIRKWTTQPREPETDDILESRASGLPLSA